MATAERRRELWWLRYERAQLIEAMPTVDRFVEEHRSSLTKWEAEKARATSRLAEIDKALKR